jgi:predicted DNA-binding transcriptional regulator AlpA
MSRVLRMPEIVRKTGRSRSSIYRDPKLRKLLFAIGERSIGALESAIDDHIERQARKGAGARSAEAE